VSAGDCLQDAFAATLQIRNPFSSIGHLKMRHAALTRVTLNMNHPKKSFDQLAKILACIQKVPASSPSGEREEFERFRGSSQIDKKTSRYIKWHHNITHSLHCDYNNLYIPTNTNKVYKMLYILC